MNSKQMNDFEQLTTVKDRARFLLGIGVTAKTNIVGLDVVSQACVGDVLLPVTAASDELAIKKGIAWLQAKSDT